MKETPSTADETAPAGGSQKKPKTGRRPAAPAIAMDSQYYAPAAGSTKSKLARVSRKRRAQSPADYKPALTVTRAADGKLYRTD